MFRFKNHPPSSGPKNRPMKSLLLLSAVGGFMALGFCSEAPPKPPPLPTVTVTANGHRH
jgi:hypothetical protein